MYAEGKILEGLTQVYKRVCCALNQTGGERQRQDNHANHISIYLLDSSTDWKQVTQGEDPGNTGCTESN